MEKSVEIVVVSPIMVGGEFAGEGETIEVTESEARELVTRGVCKWPDKAK